MLPPITASQNDYSVKRIGRCDKISRTSSNNLSSTTSLLPPSFTSSTTSSSILPFSAGARLFQVGHARFSEQTQYSPAAINPHQSYYHSLLRTDSASTVSMAQLLVPFTQLQTAMFNGTTPTVQSQLQPYSMIHSNSNSSTVYTPMSSQSHQVLLSNINVTPSSSLVNPMNLTLSQQQNLQLQLSGRFPMYPPVESLSQQFRPQLNQFPFMSSMPLSLPSSFMEPSFMHTDVLRSAYNATPALNSNPFTSFVNSPAMSQVNFHRSFY